MSSQYIYRHLKKHDMTLADWMSSMDSYRDHKWDSAEAVTALVETRMHPRLAVRVADILARDTPDGGITLDVLVEVRSTVHLIMRSAESV